MITLLRIFGVLATGNTDRAREIVTDEVGFGTGILIIILAFAAPVLMGVLFVIVAKVLIWFGC